MPQLNAGHESDVSARYFPFIETSRLSIALCDAAAAGELALIMANPAVFSPYYVDRAAGIVQTGLSEEWSFSGYGQEQFIRLNFTVVERITRELLGNVQFAGENLSYFLKPSCWGRGYGSEMVQACCQKIPTLLGLRVVTASTIRENVASRRILEKSGFAFAGLRQRTGYRGHGQYAMLHYRLHLSDMNTFSK